MHVVADAVRNAATLWPTRTAVEQGETGRRLTFAQVDQRATALAVALRERGLVPGDRVAMLCQNEVEYFEIQAACQRSGLVLVPMNFRFAVPELQFVVGHAEPRALIHGDGFADAAAALAVEHTLHLGREGHGQPYDDALGRASGTELPDRAIDADAACALLYTSGTTDRPKGALISNGALAARVAAWSMEYRQTWEDTFIQSMPMFHVAGHVSYAFLARGARNVVFRSFDSVGIAEAIESQRATHTLLVPTTINMICSDPATASIDLTSLKTMMYGSSGIPAEVLRQALDRFDCRFVQTYGSTESGPVTHLRPWDHDAEKHPELLQSAGTTDATVDMRIVDEDGTPVRRGQTGQVVVRGPGVMLGYWQDPEATDAAFADGWLHMGDLALQNESEHIFIVDRLKDMILTGGENVASREVEEVLYQHDSVLEAVVIGIPHPRWGEAVHAVVAFHPGRAVSPDVLLTFCRDRLAGYKVPKSVDVLEVLPKNATGKIMKRDLRASYWAESSRQVL